MKRIRRGFTLVEVTLFLAITAAVFVAIAVGTQNSIFQQRYNDAVQNFTEFLRSVYSQVSNVQSEGMGRSDQAIYGKLVTFGVGDDGNRITSYNVIGEIGKTEESTVLDKLAKLNASIVLPDGSPVGIIENYKPRWASQIQTTSAWNDGYRIFEGTLLIVRHPSSGVIYTFIMRGNDLNKAIEDNVDGNNPLLGFLSDEYFKVEDVDFCVNPNGANRSSLRRNVRIIAGARNASGIEIISDSQEFNVEGDNVGNRCE